MVERILIVAPAGPTRTALTAFLGSRCRSLCSVERETVIAERALYVDAERILVHGDDVTDAEVAIILDSGFMWPLPMLDPTRAQWDEHRHRFDDYLRDERESASLWFSFLDIVNVCVPLCINRQGAFALEAMKPDAFELLRAAGVAVAPMIATNSPEALVEFTKENPVDLLELSLCQAAPRWLDRNELAALNLDQAPVLVQAVTRGETTRVMVIGGEAQVLEGPGSIPTAEIEVIQHTLGAEWTELIFRRTNRGWVLSDFTAAPSIAGAGDAVTDRVLERLWALIQGRIGGS